MLKWIFFDIGNVILNDDPAMAVYYHEIFKVIQAQGNHITFDQILKDREESILNNRDGRHYISVALKYLGRKIWSQHEERIREYLMENWAKVSPLMPPIVPVIQQLAKKYNLGIIANQPAKAGEILKSHDLLKYFKIHGFSQAIGMSKPSPAFFHWALEQANCTAANLVMIGDRIDNDILPAKSVGMKTIWFPVQQAKKGFEPETEIEVKYLSSLMRACVSHLKPRGEAETPDGTAFDFNEILTEVEKVAGLTDKKNIY